MDALPVGGVSAPGLDAHPPDAAFCGAPRGNGARYRSFPRLADGMRIVAKPGTTRSALTRPDYLLRRAHRASPEGRPSSVRRLRARPTSSPPVDRPVRPSCHGNTSLSASASCPTWTRQEPPTSLD